MPWAKNRSVLQWGVLVRCRGSHLGTIGPGDARRRDAIAASLQAAMCGHVSPLARLEIDHVLQWAVSPATSARQSVRGACISSSMIWPRKPRSADSVACDDCWQRMSAMTCPTAHMLGVLVEQLRMCACFFGSPGLRNWTSCCARGAWPQTGPHGDQRQAHRLVESGAAWQCLGLDSHAGPALWASKGGASGHARRCHVVASAAARSHFGRRRWSRGHSLTSCAPSGTRRMASKSV